MHPAFSRHEPDSPGVSTRPRPTREPTDNHAIRGPRVRADDRGSRMRLPSTLPGWDTDAREKGSRCGSRPRSNLVGGHFGRCRRQGEKGEEIGAPRGVRSEAALEASEGILVFEQRDDDTLGRWMLSLSEPRAAAPGAEIGRAHV